MKEMEAKTENRYEYRKPQEKRKHMKPSRETKNTDTPILERYIHTIFRKVFLDGTEIECKNEEE